ncbi:hypothetical protein QBC34DRAFT_98110 [Podospora aff. communis PSN243]|uniref:Uncharacterized protein n=1 Tax=Podospora aff. communis PSN243 TaxID=3040156 RepID=A0AAV9GLJ5_9PEZI|nr:hypothetical protein QBC34DRAFT_98110 [Podospora aff. communis PSN243]
MDQFHPPRRPPLHQHASSRSLSRISDVSDFADLDIPLHPRPSLVSLPSYDNLGARSLAAGANTGSGPATEHTIYGSQHSSGWSNLPTSYQSHGDYEAVPLVGGSPSPPRRQPSRPFVHTASLRRHQHREAIPEEEEGIDLGLIRSAAPIGQDDVPGSPLVHDSTEAFDLSSMLGPTTSADEAFLKRLQEQEAKGTLTGGLGVGIKAEARLTESDLIASSPLVEKAPLGRSFSMAGSLSRKKTVRQLGQDAANKEGKVIEVIMEEPAKSEVDLSVMAGPDALPNSAGSMRQATFPTKMEKTQVFYPQPNWRPFSMRPPYLLMLIVLSIGLGAAQEALFQISEREKGLVKFQSPSDIPMWEYFAFKFVPTIVAVSYGVLWQVTDFEVKRLEAFYQLSKENGAVAAESINVDYITYFSFLRPFRAFYCKHYAVAVSAIASLLANTLVPTLCAACIVLSPDRYTRSRFPDLEKMVKIHPVWSRVLTVTLFVIAILGGVLFYQLQKRRSGLLADVKGIAGLASMAVVSHILMDFKDMDVATHKDIHHKLKDHRYVLLNSSLAPDDVNPISKQERDRYKTNHLSENPHPLMLRSMGIIPYITFLGLFMILIPVFLFTDATVITDRAPWIMTALAICVKLGWGGIETDIRMMEPYYILSRRHAPPKTLTLDYTAMPFGWVALQGLLNRHWIVFTVCFGTVMTELLTVLVTSLANVEGRVFIALMKAGGSDKTKRLAVSDSIDDDDDPTGRALNSGQETPKSFWISLVLAMLILAYMSVVAGVVFHRRRRVFLPRQPTTIASVLAYIHQSKMLYDFVGTAKFSNAEMVKKLEGLGKTYGLGWFQGRDGQSHCGVDEEELLSGFRVGYDYSRATKPWEEGEVNWL